MQKHIQTQRMCKIVIRHMAYATKVRLNKKGVRLPHQTYKYVLNFKLQQLKNVYVMDV